MLEIVERFPPDLVLLDVDMPEMSGDKIKSLKSLWKTKSIPVFDRDDRCGQRNYQVWIWRRLLRS
jgi:DNA-binding response OmpR family regulator